MNQPTPETRLSMRIPPDLLQGLRRVSNESRLSQVAIVTTLLDAFIRTWDETGEISFPFRVVPESTWKRHQKAYLETQPKDA